MRIYRKRPNKYRKTRLDADLTPRKPINLSESSTSSTDDDDPLDQLSDQKKSKPFSPPSGRRSAHKQKHFQQRRRHLGPKRSRQPVRRSIRAG